MESLRISGECIGRPSYGNTSELDCVGIWFGSTANIWRILETNSVHDPGKAETVEYFWSFGKRLLLLDYFFRPVTLRNWIWPVTCMSLTVHMLTVVGSTFCLPAPAINTSLDQKWKSVKCIYVAIGQKSSTLDSKSELKLANFLQKPPAIFLLTTLAVHEGINIAMNSFEREFSDSFAGVPLHEV